MDSSRRASPSSPSHTSRNGSRSPFMRARSPHGPPSLSLAPSSATSCAPTSFSAALTSYVQSHYLAALVPQATEYTEKENLRVRLETLAQKVLPGVKLKPFGSTANGLSLRNSGALLLCFARQGSDVFIDMDLCCLLPAASDSPRSAGELVEALGTAIQQQTDFMVKMLPRARIPIIKLGIPASPNSPFGMSCDIGFGNRLALQNTRLLLSYVQLDPRVRPMILFIKVWTKRRKINNPYLGTLSSYGYALLVLAFLMHVRSPAVLPNLQTFPPTDRIPIENLEIDGHDVYFNDNTTAVKRLFGTPNTDNLGDLLIAFFHYYAREKGWLRDNEAQLELFGGSRDLNRLCIEDPFQIDYNVARTVTRDGLYTIRGEFMRATRTLASRNENLKQLINELCEERAEEALVVQPPGVGGNRRVSAPSPRLAPVTTMTGTISIPQSANDFRQWVEANSSQVDFHVNSSGQLLPARSALSESGDVSPTLPPSIYPPFNPRTNRNGVANMFNPPLRGPLKASRGAHSPPVLERRLSWDGPRQQRRSSAQHQRQPRSMQGSVAQTAPASPLLGVEDRTSTMQPRSLSGSSLERRHQQSTHINGFSGAASPTMSEHSFSASPIRFGNFASSSSSSTEGKGLGLFGSSSYVEDDADFEADILQSSSSAVGSEKDVILFGDLPVVRRDEDTALQRSGGASSDQSVTGMGTESSMATTAHIPSSSTFAAVLGGSGRPLTTAHSLSSSSRQEAAGRL